jgi:hypothetical protein
MTMARLDLVGSSTKFRALLDDIDIVSAPSGAAAKLRIPPSTLETRIEASKINKQQFKFA